MTAGSEANGAAPEIDIDPATVAKIEVIIRDAREWWAAVLLCVCLVGVGALIIGAWYLMRFVQWRKMAHQHPMLLNPDAPRNSLGQRFQAAQTSLLIGMSVGWLVWFLILVVIILAFALAPE